MADSQYPGYATERAPYIRAELAYWSEWAVAALNDETRDRQAIAEHLLDVMEAIRHGVTVPNRPF